MPVPPSVNDIDAAMCPIPENKAGHIGEIHPHHRLANRQTGDLARHLGDDDRLVARADGVFAALIAAFGRLGEDVAARR